MKKTYIEPTTRVIELFTKSGVMELPVVGSESANENEYLIKEEKDFDTETVGGSKNLWDEEW